LVSAEAEVQANGSAPDRTVKAARLLKQKLPGSGSDSLEERIDACATFTEGEKKVLHSARLVRNWIEHLPTDSQCAAAAIVLLDAIRLQILPRWIDNIFQAVIGDGASSRQS
jgi:hypothetical protein